MPDEWGAGVVAGLAAFAAPTWSPGGRCLAWVEVRRGAGALWVAPAGPLRPGVSVAAEPVTSAARHGGAVFAWVGSTQVAYVAQDGRLRVAALDGGPEIAMRDNGIAAAPASNQRQGLLAWVRDTGDACDVVVGPADGSAEPAQISHADFAWDPAWSPDGRTLLWHEWDLPNMPWDASRVVAAEVDGSRVGTSRVLAGGEGIAVGQPRYSPDGASLAYVSDASGWMNLWAADPDGTRRRLLVEGEFECAEPSWGPGQRSYAWSPDSTAVVVQANQAGLGSLVTGGVDQRTNTRVPGWHRGLNWGERGTVAVATEVSEPPRVAVLSASFEVDAVVAAATTDVGVWRPGSANHSEDPLRASMLSASGPVVNAPLLVRIHGGPTGQSVHDWDVRTEFWRSRGWTVTTPNPRGSTGYGRAYAQALHGQWGVADVEDVAAAIRRALDEGVCDPDRVVVMGGSAGGFTALLLAAHHPELVRAVVALYPVTDLRALAAHDYRFESGYTDWLVGEAYDRSPVAVADRITAPVLLLHGDGDVVVPPAQARMMVEAIERGGGEVEFHEYEGEGHGWSRPETVIDELARTEAFLARVAGPR